MKVIPTVFATNKKEFDTRLRLLEKLSRYLQIDIMDGMFVDNKSIKIREIPNLKGKKNRFEAHLMTYHPEEHLEELKKKGFKKVIAHFEAFKGKHEIDNFVEKARKLKLEIYLAVNPETDFENIIAYLHSFDGILFLGVHPGEEHQEFIKEVYWKIKKLRVFSKKIKVQVDGGVNFEVASKLRELGVDYINSGSFVYKSMHPEYTIKMLENPSKP